MWRSNQHKIQIFAEFTPNNIFALIVSIIFDIESSYHLTTQKLKAINVNKLNFLCSMFDLDLYDINTAF